MKKKSLSQRAREEATHMYNLFNVINSENAEINTFIREEYNKTKFSENDIINYFYPTLLNGIHNPIVRHRASKKFGRMMRKIK